MKVQENPRAYIVLIGDLVNNVTKGSVSNVYDEVMMPTEQIRYIASLLMPVKDKIIGIVSGNHERRSRREVDLDPDEMIADKLGVPYFGDECLIKFSFGKISRSGDPVAYVLYATHGCGGGRTIGGKLNRLSDLPKIVEGCDAYMSGHVHQIAAIPKGVQRLNASKQHVSEGMYWLISTGSYLQRAGYAITHCFDPVVLGCPVLSLSGTERKIGVRA